MHSLYCSPPLALLYFGKLFWSSLIIIGSNRRRKCNAVTTPASYTARETSRIHFLLQEGFAFLKGTDIPWSVEFTISNATTCRNLTTLLTNGMLQRKVTAMSQVKWRGDLCSSHLIKPAYCQKEHKLVTPLLYSYPLSSPYILDYRWHFGYKTTLFCYKTMSQSHVASAFMMYR